MSNSDEKEKWFAKYTSSVEAGSQAKREKKDNLFMCPCCCEFSLGEIAAYEICEICGWEDDGQDGQHADEVWGGPNGDYSLTEARENFNKYKTMYRSTDRRFKNDQN